MARHDLGRMFALSLFALLLLAVCIAVVAFQVSPLRDPNFVRGGGNAGATVGWLNYENHWIALLTIFTVALATNVTLLVWTTTRPSRMVEDSGLIDLSGLLLKVLSLSALWLVVAFGTWFGSMIFLLNQWIID